MPAATARGLGPPASGGDGSSSWGDARRFAQYAGRALVAAGLPERRSPSELARWAAAACADEGGGGGGGAGAESDTEGAADGTEGTEGATGAEGAEGAEAQGTEGAGEGGEGGRADRVVAAAGRRLAAFEALRAVLAPAVETLLLTDQLLFLQAPHPTPRPSHSDRFHPIHPSNHSPVHPFMHPPISPSAGGGM